MSLDYSLQRNVSCSKQQILRSHFYYMWASLLCLGCLPLRSCVGDRHPLPNYHCVGSREAEMEVEERVGMVQERVHGLENLVRQLHGVIDACSTSSATQEQTLQLSQEVVDHLTAKIR